MRIFTIAVSIRIFRLLHKCGVDMQCWNFNQPTERYLYRINRKNLITVFPVVSIKKEFIFFLNASFQFTKSVGGVPADLSLWSIWRCSPSCHSYYRSVFRPALRMGATQQIILVRYSTNKSQFIISPILDKDNMAFVQQMIPIFYGFKSQWWSL